MRLLPLILAGAVTLIWIRSRKRADAARRHRSADDEQAWRHVNQNDVMPHGRFAINHAGKYDPHFPPGSKLT